MYSYKERMKAVKEYIASGYRANRTVAKLGYPSHQALKNWYDEYKANGDLHRDFVRESRYTDEQKKEAVDHYYANGRNMAKTSRMLGYVSRDTLRSWIAETVPMEDVSCVTGLAVVKCTEEQKREAVVEFCARGGSSEAIANRYGVSASNLYIWKKKLYAEEEEEEMPTEPEVTLEELQQQNSELKQAIDELQRQRKRLEKDVHRLQLERDVLEKAGEIIKKEEGVSLEELSNREKVVLIDALKEKHRLQELLSLLKLSKSSYYYQEAALKAKDKYEELRQTVKKIYLDSNRCYGYRRIHVMIRRMGITVSEKVIRRIMREEGLKAICIKRKRYNSYMGEISPAVDNIINRDFHADQPNQKWLTDITEFHIPAGKVYLSPIIDCFDGMAVTWTIGTSPNADMVNSMLDEAASLLKEREYPIIHSDRGCHYRWPGWIERMEKYNLIRSMSKKGYSPDNSACEGFFGRLKNEMFYGRSWVNVSVERFIRILDNYIHWYNEERIKISLKGMSPVEYRKSLNLI